MQSLFIVEQGDPQKEISRLKTQPNLVPSYTSPHKSFIVIGPWILVWFQSNYDSGLGLFGLDLGLDNCILFLHPYATRHMYAGFFVMCQP